VRVLDLFSGIGGFSLGLERAGMRTVAFCEIDPYCRAVLRKHWPAVPCFEDVRNLRAEHVGPVDLICGGFPCQDISLAGRGAGLIGERSGLWSEYRRIIEEIKPRWIVIENVSALRSRGLDVVLGEVAALGYDAEWHCIPASAVGAPHQRDRIWIVAHAQPSERWPFDPCAGQVERQGGVPAERQEASGGPGVRSEALAYPERQRVQDDGQGAPDRAARSLQSQGHERQRLRIDLGQCADDGWRIWSSEPDVGRVANGVPSRVDRLRALGNAVVPQVVQAIGEAILEAEKGCVD
jgi:DNA (cytosine-5)-methyltransferase 1